MRRAVELGANTFAFPRGAARPDEVCIVFRRPGGDVLVMRKTFYPSGVYRLPTGGIRPGEAVLHALHREAWEETGWTVAPAQTVPIAVVTYRGGPALACRSFVFLIEGVDGAPRPQDPHEQVADFRWVPSGTLVALAGALEALGPEQAPDLESTWRDWGRFRAVVHRLVEELLRKNS
ncbi:MAG: NUDIX hydrolase [Armatimonadota bacterium]|nr:NUDIX hydrolase [Armatimonadota bacterium]MDR7465677.1 NUDIX hydrolase [Armatimonadota bacterium]MDR7493586.1 NUDIX hydrolase [Armatimonadota bacterium]MDR7499510.1 NUDIX hydrolase [Armatimonadota bacterium]MDR7503471.1 NUDIX hydrolase [Armatimonadota bacterium]